LIRLHPVGPSPGPTPSSEPWHVHTKCPHAVCQGYRPRRLFPFGRLVAGARWTVGRWFARYRQRRVLREIAERNDFHMLKDIGVTQEEAFREADKPFWRG
jgi:uncharacterized protein YjiS (DUF1127 family)